MVEELIRSRNKIRKARITKKSKKNKRLNILGLREETFKLTFSGYGISPSLGNSD